jgi:hypothetical protein
MADGDRAGSRDFSANFPERFAAATSQARGVMGALEASARPGRGGVLDAASLARLHEIYRLRVELELETAGILWRTAEMICSLTDVVEVLRSGPGRGGPGGDRALMDSIAARRNRAGITADRAAGTPDLEAARETHHSGPVGMEFGRGPTRVFAAPSRRAA